MSSSQTSVTRGHPVEREVQGMRVRILREPRPPESPNQRRRAALMAARVNRSMFRRAAAQARRASDKSAEQGLLRAAMRSNSAASVGRAPNARRQRALARNSSRAGDSGNDEGDEHPEGSEPSGAPGRRFCAAAGCDHDITGMDATAQTCSKQCGDRVRQQRRRAKLKEELPDAGDYLIRSTSDYAELRDRTRCRCARPILDLAVGDCLKCGRTLARSRRDVSSREVHEAVYGNGTRSRRPRTTAHRWRTRGSVSTHRTAAVERRLEPVDASPEIYSFAEHYARHAKLSPHQRMLVFLDLPRWQQQQAYGRVARECEAQQMAVAA